MSVSSLRPHAPGHLSLLVLSKKRRKSADGSRVRTRQGRLKDGEGLAAIKVAGAAWWRLSCSHMCSIEGFLGFGKSRSKHGGGVP